MDSLNPLAPLAAPTDRRNTWSSPEEHVCFRVVELLSPQLTEFKLEGNHANREAISGQLWNLREAIKAASHQLEGFAVARPASDLRGPFNELTKPLEARLKQSDGLHALRAVEVKRLHGRVTSELGR